MHYFWNTLFTVYFVKIYLQKNRISAQRRKTTTYHQQIPAVGTVALTHRVHSTVNTKLTRGLDHNTNRTRALGHGTNPWTWTITSTRRDCRRCRVFLNLAIVSPQHSGDHTTKYIRHNARCSPASSAQVALRVVSTLRPLVIRPNSLPRMSLKNSS